MPKIQSRSAPAKKPVKDLVNKVINKGHAYTLAELAEEYGVMVKDVSKSRLTEAGLPADLPHHVKLLAHKIHRDMVDAAHHRLRKEVGQ